MVDPNEGTDTQEVSEKIVINGQEYDAKEAQDLIGLGQKTREAEAKYHTTFDRVWPEYGKSQTELTKEREARAKAESDLNDFRQKQQANVETPSDVKQAREAAKKLGIILDEDLKNSGYVKRDDLEEYLTERETKKTQEQENVQKVFTAADELEKEINGADGRPKFNKRIVMAYANAYNFQGETFKDILLNAYNDMNQDVLTEWQNNQISAKKSPGLKTLKGGATMKEPKAVKIDDSNFQEALKESLWGNKE